jgi:hypothetical protein
MLEKFKRGMKLSSLVIVGLMIFISCKDPDPAPPAPGPSGDGDTTVPYAEGLPKIYINTENGAPVESKDVYLNATFSFVDSTGEYAKIDPVATTIKGRGNSTWWDFPKKPYRLKFPEKISLFNLTAAKNWVLLANYQDPTFLLNTTTFKIANILGMPYTHNAFNVDLYMNGEYVGNYLLTEQNEVKTGRVDIDEFTEYLMEIDNYYDEAYKFKTNIIQLPVMLKSPEADAAVDSMQKFMNKLERLMFEKSENFPNNNWRDMVDVPSLIDYLIVNEIVFNSEIRNPASVYCYVKNDGKLYFGPCWDFDRAYSYNYSDFLYFTPTTGTVLHYDTPIEELTAPGSKFWVRFFADKSFKTQFKQRWDEVEPQLSSIYSYIDSVAALNATSYKLDYVLWNKSHLDYQDQIHKLKTYLQVRIDWLKNYKFKNL